jgi:hypothetical protein
MKNIKVIAFDADDTYLSMKPILMKPRKNSVVNGRLSFFLISKTIYGGN